MAEVPKVRKDFGYPPLVTRQAKSSVRRRHEHSGGERYKMVTKESKALLRGEYGQLPAPVDPEVQKKVIGDDELLLAGLPTSQT